MSIVWQLGAHSLLILSSFNNGIVSLEYGIMPLKESN